MAITTGSGLSFPLGATVKPGGVNFVLYSRHAEAVELLLYAQPGDVEPSHLITLDPEENRTFDYWHVFVEGIESGQLYAFSVHGPRNRDQALMFDGSKILVDPYARAVANDEGYSRVAATGPGTNAGQAYKSVVVDESRYDWEGDVPLKRPYDKSLIYEMHVRGFTRDPSSGIEESKRGTYAGVVEKIPYLQELGVTAVELMPVQQFDDQDAPADRPNYWGYSPVAYFAPHRAYSSRRDPEGPVTEFRDMVKAFHRAGIEVILDVVFNHTAEAGFDGPCLSFKGIENSSYYMLSPGEPRHYLDYTGCGHTVNTNHTITRRLIVDCLRYWVEHMHVDGFRFDLASVLSRGEQGHPLDNPPLPWDIETEPALSGTKIIAEAWDAAGLYQVGSFVGHRWSEWNGQYRDDIRAFVKGTPGKTLAVAKRIAGSPDLYNQPDRDPHLSINFVTCHDGFTLNDLVSYNRKHNEANGEDNRDGANDNHSWNCGFEGQTEDSEILLLRQRQMKNHLALLLLSQGTPMLLMGDEYGRSQGGNNNAYCQDSPLSWFDWRPEAHNADLGRFLRQLIQFCQQQPLFSQKRFWGPPGGKRLTFSGVRIGEPDWGHHSHSLAYTVADDAGARLHVCLNAYWESLSFELPPLPARHRWRAFLNTSAAVPHDITPVDEAPRLNELTVDVPPRTILALWSKD